MSNAVFTGWPHFSSKRLNPWRIASASGAWRSAIRALQNRCGSQYGGVAHSRTILSPGGHRTRSHGHENCSGIPVRSSGQPRIAL